MQSELRREGLSMTIKSSSCDDHTAAFPPLGKGIKALMVWPDFPGSFWSFAGMMEMLDEKVVMPPLGLVTVAALCPKEWTIRLIDQQVDEVSAVARFNASSATSSSFTDANPAPSAPNRSSPNSTPC